VPGFCFWAFPADSRQYGRHAARQAGRLKGSAKLQRAARALLLRLVAENGVEEAAAILRSMADELEGLPVMYAVRTRITSPGVVYE